MIKLNIDMLKNNDYSRDDNGFFERIDTSNFTELTATNYYAQFVINFASYVKGSRVNKSGKTIEYELISLELTRPAERVVTHITINANGVRTQELMYLCGIQDLEMKDITTKSGKEMTVLPQLPGKYIDVVLDNFNYNNNGYIVCEVLGFFKNGFSVAEIISGTQAQNDIKLVMGRVKKPIGEKLPPKNNGMNSGMNSGMMYNNNNQRPKVMPSVIPQQGNYAPPPSDNDIPF